MSDKRVCPNCGSDNFDATHGTAAACAPPIETTFYYCHNCDHEWSVTHQMSDEDWEELMSNPRFD